jgi:hypothetical protein
MPSMEATGGPLECSRCGRIAFLEVEAERWLAFEEVFLPAWVQERARELARGY